MKYKNKRKTQNSLLIRIYVFLKESDMQKDQ